MKHNFISEVINYPETVKPDWISPNVAPTTRKHVCEFCQMTVYSTVPGGVGMYLTALSMDCSEESK